MIWDKNYREVLYEVAKETNSKPSEVDEVWNSIWVFTKRAMQEDNLPEIVLQGWGKYYVSVDDLRGRLTRAIKNYRKGRISPAGLAKIFNRYWEYYKTKQEDYVRIRKERKDRAANKVD